MASPSGASSWFNLLPAEIVFVCNELSGHERGSPLRGEVLKMGFSQGRKHLQLAKNTHWLQLLAPPWLYLQRGARRGCTTCVPGVAASKSLEIPKGRRRRDVLASGGARRKPPAHCRDLGISCDCPGERFPVAMSLIRSPLLPRPAQGMGRPSAAWQKQPCGSSQAVPAWSCQPAANLQPVSKHREKQEHSAVR